MVFLLKCHFSKVRKYFVFFSPSLCHRDLDLNIAPRVLYFEISSLCRILTSILLQIWTFSFSEMLFFSNLFWRHNISDSSFNSSDFILAFFLLAQFRELDLICIFMVSHNRMASISLLFAYSFATSVIVFLIKPTYSSSNRKEVQCYSYFLFCSYL